MHLPATFSFPIERKRASSPSPYLVRCKNGKSCCGVQSARSCSHIFPCIYPSLPNYCGKSWEHTYTSEVINIWERGQYANTRASHVVVAAESAASWRERADRVAYIAGGAVNKRLRRWRDKGAKRCARARKYKWSYRCTPSDTHEFRRPDQSLDRRRARDPACHSHVCVRPMRI